MKIPVPSDPMYLRFTVILMNRPENHSEWSDYLTHTDPIYANFTVVLPTTVELA